MSNREPVETPDPSDSLFGPRPRRGPIALLIDLFSSVRFGIVLMVVLFIYCTIGSAGILYPEIGPGKWNPLNPAVWRHDMIRQWRVFELTEFEWFHTAFFNALIALICLTLIVTTIRRIRFNALTAGVWMIHSGIVILSIGSFIYFGTKFEGDAPVMRQEVVIDVPGAPAATLPAMPGNATSVRTDAGEFVFSIVSIDPAWELRTEGDEGKRAYAVTVDVQTPIPPGRFMRQLLAGYPQYTEDVIQGKGRVKKLPEFEGRALVDESIVLSLEAPMQDSFWVKDSAALCVREVGAGLEWSQRVIEGLPRYNDSIAALADVWPMMMGEGERPLQPRILDLPVPPPNAEADPLAGIDARITGYLRYAVMQRGFVPGGPVLNPVAELTMTTPDGQVFNESLVAFDETRRSAYDGRLSFDWIESAEALPQFLDAGSRELTLRVPEAGIEEIIKFRVSDLAATDRPMTPLGETGWQFLVREAKDRLPLSSGRSVTLLLVDFVNPEGKKFTRWVFEDPSRNRDNHETAMEDPHTPQVPDPRIETLYRPGRTLSTISLVAGPGDIGMHVFFDDGAGNRTQRTLTASEPVEITYGIKLDVRRLVPDALETEKPLIVPRRQRDKDADSVQAYALVRVELSKADWRESRWVPFHRYTFEEPLEPTGVLSRFEPRLFTLPDGREVEVMVGRERRPLPHAVRLDDFVLTANVGGFTGRMSSVRDWTSVIRFQDEQSWTDPVSVSTNNPGTFEGMWFFQAFWDPPRPGRFAGDVASQGLNFTGLGVGNRQGVYVQLFGCCLAVAGMIYAFYIKPIIRRRRRARVLAELEAGRLPRRVKPLALDETPIRDHSLSPVNGQEVSR